MLAPFGANSKRLLSKGGRKEQLQGEMTWKGFFFFFHRNSKTLALFFCFSSSCLHCAPATFKTLLSGSSTCLIPKCIYRRISRSRTVFTEASTRDTEGCFSWLLQSPLQGPQWDAGQQRWDIWHFQVGKSPSWPYIQKITQVLKLLTALKQPTSKGPSDLFAEEPQTKFFFSHLLLLLLSPFPPQCCAFHY